MDNSLQALLQTVESGRHSHKCAVCEDGGLRPPEKFFLLLYHLNPIVVGVLNTAVSFDKWRVGIEKRDKNVAESVERLS